MSNKRKLKVIKQGAETMEFLRSMGMEPAAPPRSGRCMVCGKTLNTDPSAGEVDKDHSLCNACFPPDMADLQGVSFDYAALDLDAPGGPKITEIPGPPPDPFI